MDICHPHNRRAGLTARSGPWGLRLRLPQADTFRAVLGEDWETVEWFPSEAARQTLLCPYDAASLPCGPSFCLPMTAWGW